MRRKGNTATQATSIDYYAKNDVLEKLDEEILQVCEVETIEKVIEDSEEYKMKLMDIVYDITRKVQRAGNTNGSPIETNQPQTPTTNEIGSTIISKPTYTDPPISPSSASTSTTSTSRTVRTKLPKIS